MRAGVSGRGKALEAQPSQLLDCRRGLSGSDAAGRPRRVGTGNGISLREVTGDLDKSSWVAG